MSARFFDHHGTAQPSPLREQLVLLIRDLRESFAARVEVARTEFRASAHELVGGVVMLVAAALFGIGAWLAVCALAAVGLVALGLTWLTALLAVAVANAVLAAIALASARRRFRHVGMTHTYHAFLGHHRRNAAVTGQPQYESMPDLAKPPVQGIHHGAS